MKTKIAKLIDEYYESLDFRSLGTVTQKDYRYCINTLLATSVRGKRISTMYLESLDTPRAQAAYNGWAERGVPFANHTHAVASKLYNFAIQLGYTDKSLQQGI